MHNTPINMAESIFELFTDPGLSGLTHWEIDAGDSHGLNIEQRWSFVLFEWSTRPASGPALRMRREFAIDCSAYDQLMISPLLPEKSVLRVEVDTDAGLRTHTTSPAGLLKREVFVPLEGARQIRSIVLEVWTEQEGAGVGWLNWIGLQHTQLLERYESQWKRFDDQWELYLKPDTYEPSFTPTYGIVINREELDMLRAKHQDWLAQHGGSPFLEMAEKAQKHQPEQMIGEFVNFWNDTRYARERDYGNLLLTHGMEAAAAAVLTKDKALHRLAARYAMSIAMCGRWDSGFLCYMPGSVWEHRAFVQSLCMEETAMILDLAGEWFTDYGKEFVLRRIAEDGQGNINLSTWKHEYIFHCNQMPWFSPGRLLGYAVLEQTMPRAKPYTELAVRDLVESIENTIMPDGGFEEGPMYFTWSARQCVISLYYYARLRGLELSTVLPDSLKRTAALAEALLSTDEQAVAILVCDAIYVDQRALAYLAAFMPDSQWVTMFRKSLKLLGGIPDSLPAYLLESSVPQEGPPLRPFVQLPDMGLISSVRYYEGEPVKLMLMGNRANATHTHEDKGHFVLEFAGETYAMEFGTVDYSSPMAEVLKHAQRHNMLVPVGTAERARPQNALPYDVRPQGSGDERTFQASIDVTPGWEGYYRRWVRTWDSPSPDMLTITDDYALEQGNGVEFYWTTRLVATIEGDEIVLCGKRGLARIAIPEGCTARIDELPLLSESYDEILYSRRDWLCGNLYLGRTQTRIAICRPEREGRLSVQVRLEKIGEGSTKKG